MYTVRTQKIKKVQETTKISLKNIGEREKKREKETKTPENHRRKKKKKKKERMREMMRYDEDRKFRGGASYQAPKTPSSDLNL